MDHVNVLLASLPSYPSLMSWCIQCLVVCVCICSRPEFPFPSCKRNLRCKGTKNKTPHRSPFYLIAEHGKSILSNSSPNFAPLLPHAKEQEKQKPIMLPSTRTSIICDA